MAPLNVIDFGFKLGIFWGVSVLVLGGVCFHWRKAEGIVNLFGKVYRGFRPTLLGCLTGAAWGFVDGMISGLLIAWIFNIFVS